MKYLLLMLLLAGSLPGRTPAQYDLLVQRNIFDPNRAPQAASRPTTTYTPPPAPVPRDSLALVGVAILDGEATAVFTGNQSGFNGQFQVGDSIGPWRIAAINTESVKLETAEQTVSLPVGRALKQVTDEEWTVAERATPRPAAASSTPAVSGSASTTPATGAASAASAAPLGGDANLSVLERLRLRRQQELQP